MIAVSIGLGKSSDWVMENMTAEQVGLHYSKIKKFEYEYQENQAKQVWILMKGWGKKDEVSLDKAKELGLLKDTV